MSKETPSLSTLILEATEQGYDVTIKCRHRSDGRPGELTLPNGWARHLGMSWEQMAAAREHARKARE